MAQANYVFSTLANNQMYTNYDQPASKGGVPIERCSVLIRGGAGVADGSSGGIITPNGLATSVTDEQLCELEKNEDFKRHKAANFITVRARSADVDKVAADMSKTDKSRPFTPASREMNEPEYIEVQ